MRIVALIFALMVFPVVAGAEKAATSAKELARLEMERSYALGFKVESAARNARNRIVRRAYHAEIRRLNATYDKVAASGGDPEALDLIDQSFEALDNLRISYRVR